MSALAGTPVLARLALRHDRVRLSAWILGLCVFLAGTAAGQIGAMTREDLLRETEFNAGSPALRMFGLASGATSGAYTMLRDYLTLAVLAAVMSTLTVVRHTRTEEETGRAELVGAAATGRHAIPTAALIVTVGANGVLAVLLGLTLIAVGEPAAGSLAAGASVGAVGAVFAGVAAVTAQLSATARQANGLAAAVLGVAFLLSGVGNMLGSVDASGVRATSTWPAWLSPIGWGEHMRPFAGDHWWPLSLFALLSIALVGVAAVLATRRDIGRGVLPERRGRAHASPGLLRPLGLVWRLQRGALLGWTAGMLAFGAIFGLIIDQVNDLEGSAADWYTQVGGTDQIEDAYLTSVISMAGMAVAIYVVQMLARMRAEETEGHLEPLLAAAISRPRWVMSHVLNAGLGAVALLLAFALSVGIGSGAALGDLSGQLGAATGTSLAQLPAILVIGACVIAATGLLPRWAGALSWTIVALAILLGPLFGPTVDLPQWAQDLSPFTHIPKLPAAALTVTPIVALTAIATALALAGVSSFRRRNLALPT
jgi:ABC-2 type transport system permease protein